MDCDKALRVGTALAAPHWPFLDIVRGGSACLVMLGHVRFLYFKGIDSVDYPSALTKSFYLLTGLQNAAAVMFFVVSGFLVGGLIWRDVEVGNFNGFDYFVKRLVRIYIVFIPALVLAFAVIVPGRELLGDTRGFSSFRDYRISADAVICHLANLQGMFCPVVPSNGALWSLSYEWALYIVAPFCFAVLSAPVARRWRLAMLALLAATAYTLLDRRVEWMWFGFWVAGVLAWRLQVKASVPATMGLAGLFLVAGACLLSRLHVVDLAVTDALVALGLSAAVATRAVIGWSPAPRAFRHLADCSYSLYVTHLPLSYLVVGLFEKIGWSTTVSEQGFVVFAQYFSTVGFVLAGAVLFGKLFEDRTARVRRLVLRRRSPADRALERGPSLS